MLLMRYNWQCASSDDSVFLCLSSLACLCLTWRDACAVPADNVGLPGVSMFFKVGPDGGHFCCSENHAAFTGSSGALPESLKLTRYDGHCKERKIA